MNFSRLDIFSSPFQFDFGNEVKKKNLQNACVSKVEGLNDGKNQLLEENEKIERNEFITVPSFFTKSIKQVDNQNNLLYTEELNTQIQNICKNEVKVQEVLNKSKFDNSVMNFDKRLNDQQRRNQIRKNQTNLPLTKKGQIEIQKFNSQQVQNLKDKEIMQETSFLGSNRSGIFNRSQFIQTDSKQFQAKSPYISNNIQEYHIKRAKAIQNSTILKDVHSKIFKFKCFKQSNYQQHQGLDQQDKHIIDSQVNESLNILQIYRDLMFLKKAIMILFSQEQLAALQLIGLSSNFMKSFNKQEQNCEPLDQMNNQQMSFFEEQYTILKNSDLQEQYLISFFEKMKNDQGLSEVDYRILNSLL
ncbi:hypothetical protein ABPG73_008834 [Tetrahymena malaccensis]